MQCDFNLVEKDPGRLHGGAHVQRHPSRSLQRGNIQGATIFTFTEPMVSSVQIADKRGMRQVHLRPTGFQCGIAETTKAPAMVEVEVLTHAVSTRRKEFNKQ